MTGRWSHLTADTYEELHALAVKIGMRRAWFQKPKLFPVNWVTERAGVAGKEWTRGHYDVVESRRAAAIRAGAVAVGNGDEPWRATDNARTVWLDFVKSDEGKLAVSTYKAQTGHHPARHPS